MNNIMLVEPVEEDLAILYRVYPAGSPAAAELTEAVDGEDALARLQIPPEEWDYWVAEPFEDVIENECVCTQADTLETVPFVNLAHPNYPGLWECQGCGRQFDRPPDTINWDRARGT